MDSEMEFHEKKVSQIADQLKGREGKSPLVLKKKQCPMKSRNRRTRDIRMRNLMSAVWMTFYWLTQKSVSA